MKMEITVNTIDKTKPNNRNTSLKTLYPRYTRLWYGILMYS